MTSPLWQRSQFLLASKTPRKSHAASGRSKLLDQKILYPRFYYTPASSLLLTCRTTLAEVGVLQQRLHLTRGIPTCKLDLIITRRYVLPTWIYAPGQDRETEYNLEISLRLMDVLRHCTLGILEDWIGTISAPLMTILNRLVHHGPRFLPPVQSPAPEPLRFNFITMDVSCPSTRGVGPCELYYAPPLLGKVSHHAFVGVYKFIWDLEYSGLLWEKVREVRIYSMQMGKGMSVRTTHQPTNQKKLDYWAHKGYIWGPNA